MKVATKERRIAYDQLLSAIDEFSEAFGLFDGDLSFRFINGEAERLLNRRLEELEGVSLFAAFPEAKNSVFEEAIERCLKKGEKVEFHTFFGTGKDARWYSVRVSPADGGVFLHLRELAPLSEPEFQREAIVRETNHRVKNSLALISSLVRLERDGIADEPSRSAFGRLEGRIEATGHLYDLLSRSASSSSIDAAVYVADLASLVAANFSRAGDWVRVELALSCLELDARRAAALGLLANEAMTNSFKYAFSGERPGRLRVELAVSGEKPTFAVEDDGPGFPSGFDLGRDGDIGYALMADKARELGGKIAAHNAASGRGARLEVSFPV